jgi:PAS domain S-box-containing protein
MNPAPDNRNPDPKPADNSGSRVVVKPPDNRFWLPLVLIFLVLVATIIGMGYYRWHQGSFVEMAHDQLTAIVEAKSDELKNWYQERSSQVRRIASTLLTTSQFRQVLVDPANELAQHDVAGWLTARLDDRAFSTIALFDGQGVLRLMVPAAPATSVAMSKHMAEHAAAALKARTLVFDDFHRAPNGEIRLAFAIPIGLPSDAGTPLDGVLVLLVDPARYLYPSIRRWLTPSPTAETLLVRREGDEVVFLNELRHRSGTALEFRLPIQIGSTLPAAQAVLGREGVVEGLDYQGVPVLAAIRAVPGTPWFLVGKVAQDEIFAPLRRQAWNIAATMAALILAAGLGVGWFWHANNADFLRRRRETEQERDALAGRIRFLNQQANDILILVNSKGRIIEANNRALEAYGYPLEELTKRTLFELCAPESTAEFQQVSGVLESGVGAVFESTHQRKDGSHFPVETSMRTFSLEGRSYQQHIIRDITKRRKLERELAETRDFLENMFDSANSMIVATDPDRKIKRFNRAAEQLSGYAADEVIGQNLSFLFPPASREEALERIAATSGSEHQEPVEIPILRKDGQVRLTLWNSAKIYKGDRKTLLGTIAQGQDITERKRMEAALRKSDEQFRALANTSPGRLPPRSPGA